MARCKGKRKGSKKKDLPTAGARKAPGGEYRGDEIKSVKDVRRKGKGVRREDVKGKA